MKKIVIFSIIGVLISGLVFGGVAYFTIFSKGSDKEVTIYNYQAGEFSTNLGNTRHYFKGNITIGLSNKKEIEVLSEKNIALRDMVLSILIQQNPEDVMSSEGMDKIKKQLKDGISENLKIDSIEKIYFTDYIVQ